MNKQLISITFLFSSIFSISCAQNTNKSQGSSSFVSIDSVADINIFKIIFYSNPIELKYNALTNNSFMPTWYKTFCAGENMEYFNYSAIDAINYYAKESGIRVSDLQDSYNVVKNKGGVQAAFEIEKEEPYLYIFNEIWLFEKTHNNNYLLIQGYNSKEPLKNMKFATKLLARNLKNEKVDSLKNQKTTLFIFKVDNDTAKWVDQGVLDDVIGKNKVINPYLHKFKDICYRKSAYFHSEVENGKRVFKTMEKDKDGSHKVKKVSDKPE